MKSARVVAMVMGFLLAGMAMGQAQKQNIELRATLAGSGGFVSLQGTALLLTSGVNKKAPKADGYWFDIGKDPATPALVCGEVPNAWEIAVMGDHALVVDYTNNLTVYDMRQRPWKRVAKLAMPSMTENIIVRGKLAYVANHVAGLTIVDVERPEEPKIVSNLNPKIDCDAIGLLENCAVLYGHWESRLVMADVSDPAKPRELGVYQNDPKTFNQGQIAIDNGIAYCTMTKGVAVVDVRKAAEPKRLSVIPLAGAARDVRVADGYCFVAGAKQGVRVWDVRRPEEPVEAGFYRDAETLEALGLAVKKVESGGMSYVATGKGAGMAMEFVATE